MADDFKGDSLWRNVEKVYDKMHETVDHNSVWEGFTTRLQADLGIPIPYYGHIMDALKRMGCVDQLQRGGGTAPSRWVLYKKPTLMAYVEIRDQLKSRPRANTSDALEQRVVAMEERLGGLDVRKALADLQVQIDVLKGEAYAVA